VHGSHPDAPAAESAQVGPLAVRLAPGNWEELLFSCVFDGEPLAEDAEELADLIRGFVIVAWYGGFSGARASRGSSPDRWLGRAHGLRVNLKGSELQAVIDLGTCPPVAVEQLCAALSGFCQERVPMAYLRIGGA